MDMQTDIFAEEPFGRVALRKLAPVSPAFRLYSGAWLGDKPSEWEVMRVIGAEFREAKSGPRKGQFCILVKGTTRTAFVTSAEIAEEGRTNPMNITDDSIEDAKAVLDQIDTAVRCGNVAVSNETFRQWHGAIDKLIQRQRERQAVPSGCKIVPIEPTFEMIKEARTWQIDVFGKSLGRYESIGSYKAMLAAAPLQELISPHPVNKETGK